jgi:hypothetical protein
VINPSVDPHRQGERSLQDLSMMCALFISNKVVYPHLDYSFWVVNADEF